MENKCFKSNFCAAAKAGICSGNLPCVPYGNSGMYEGMPEEVKHIIKSGDNLKGTNTYKEIIPEWVDPNEG